MEGRVGFVTSSRWVEACLAHSSVGTQPGSKAILELHVISEILTATTVLLGWFFSFPKERIIPKETNLLGHSFFSYGTTEQLRSWKRGRASVGRNIWCAQGDYGKVAWVLLIFVHGDLFGRCFEISRHFWKQL